MEPSEEYDPINVVSRYELRGYMANTLLRDTDFMSMAHGLEVRVPFVDPTVVEWVLGLPGEWKVDSHRPKPLLLDAMNGLLPKRVWRRPKMGFTLPFERWLLSNLGGELESMLADTSSLSRLNINPEPVQYLWRVFTGYPRKENWSRPWALYVLMKWCDLYGVRA
jgi:asparagine synthase (glutamine-hydrolysing)